jgi:hypothetical protein
MGRGVSFQSVVVAAHDQASSHVAGETIVLGLRRSAYYGMDHVGARVWSLLQQPRPVAELHAAILDEYDIDPERCERDLVAFLDDLLAEGLIDLQTP